MAVREAIPEILQNVGEAYGVLTLTGLAARDLEIMREAERYLDDDDEQYDHQWNEQRQLHRCAPVL